MSGSLRWDGLEELKIALRSLPARLTEEAGDIIRDTAEIAETSLIQAYPLGPTGNLRRRVLISSIENRSRYGVGITLKSAAPHAWLYEHGHEIRRRKSTGKMRVPARPVFGRTMSRWRRRMWDRIAEMMEREGLTVTRGNV